MADIEDALVAYLLSYSGLTALIGTNLYPNEMPEDVNLATNDVVVYQKITDPKDHNYDGIETLERPNYQFTAFSKVKNNAVAIKEQIRAALCDYSGTLSGLTIQWAILTNEISSSSKVETLTLYTETLEFEIIYER